MLITNPTMERLQKAFREKAEGHQDLTVSPFQLDAVETEKGTAFDLEMTETAFGHEKQPIQFSDSALGQLLNRVGIPILFWNRCPSHLHVANFEYFNQKYEKEYLFRLDHGAGKNHVRAVLSDQYSVIDDIDLFKIVFNALMNREDINYRCLQWDDRITQLSINFTDCTKEYEGRKYTAGLAITNSETGHSSVWIEPVVYTRGLSFYNRKVLKKQDVDCRIVHRGVLAPERVRPMVEKAKEVAQVGLIQLIEAFQTPISCDHALRTIESIDALPSRFVQILEEEWRSQEEVIKAEAARRVIEFAQELPLFQRVTVEQQAGKMLGLFQGYKSRFQAIIQEISQ